MSSIIDEINSDIREIVFEEEAGKRLSKQKV